MAGDRSAVEAARQMVGALERMGHEVVTRHLVEDGARAADRRLGAAEVYERDMRWLESCDVLVAEASGSSFGIGFETGLLLGGTGKRAILFYRRGLESRISMLITGNRHPRCTVVPYQSVEEATRALARELAS